MARHEAVTGQESLLKSWDEVLRELNGYPKGLLTELLLGLGGIRPENGGMPLFFAGKPRKG